MLRGRRMVMLGGLGAALCGCGGGAAVPSPPAAAGGTYASAHFIFDYTTLDAGNIATI